jgi:hypothetical protein
LPYDPNERLTLADQLRLLMQQGMAEDEAKARLGKLFALEGARIYEPKFAFFSYQDSAIDWKTGRVVPGRWQRQQARYRVPREPRRSFIPTLPATRHYGLFPPTGDSRRLTAGAEKDTTDRLVALMKAGDPAHSKAWYRQEAEHEFNVGKRAFDRAWARAIDASGNTNWSRAGRKSSR